MRITTLTSPMTATTRLARMRLAAEVASIPQDISELRFERTRGLGSPWKEARETKPSPSLIAEQYLELSQKLQSVLEGTQRAAPPNWFALAVAPAARVAQAVESLEGRGCHSSLLAETLPLHALLDPRVLVSSALRLCRLLVDLPGKLAELKSFLLEGSLAIHSEIVPTMEKFLDWHGSRGKARLDPDSLILHLGHSPERIQSLLKNRQWTRAEPREMAAAAATLYHQASFALPSERNRLIGEANLCLLYLEQKRVLDPLYSQYPGLKRIFELATPFLRLGRWWSFDEYAKSLEDRDGDIFTAPICERNWASFADRWPAILDYARLAAKNPQQFWNEL